MGMKPDSPPEMEKATLGKPTGRPSGTIKSETQKGAEIIMEQMLRKEMGERKATGTIKEVQKHHLRRMIKSRAGERVIGTERGVKIWGWFSEMLDAKKVTLRLATEWTNTWISQQESRINQLKTEEAWAKTGVVRNTMKSIANREEAMGAVTSWMDKNEEPPKGGVRMLRAEKREALRTAKINVFKKMGGAEAMYAAIAVLTLEGKMVMETDRGTRGRRANDGGWLRDSLLWATASGWVRQSGDIEELSTEAESKQMQMRAKYTQREGMGELKILDVGEGWGSIGIAVSEIPGCATIGVDRVGFLDQGERFGKITSRVHLDLCSEGRRNVLRRAAKMVVRRAAGSGPGGPR